MSLPEIVVKSALTAWMITVAVWDRRTSTIPNWLTLPVALALALIRLAGTVLNLLGMVVSHTSILPVDAVPRGGFGAMLVIWVALFMIWRLNIVGGGDAKFLMGLFALFPTQGFIVAFSIMVLLISLPILVAKYWRRRPAEVLEGAVNRIVARRFFPDDEELKREGRPYAWTFCLPGVVYLWGFW